MAKPSHTSCPRAFGSPHRSTQRTGSRDGHSRIVETIVPRTLTWSSGPARTLIEREGERGRQSKVVATGGSHQCAAGATRALSGNNAGPSARLLVQRVGQVPQGYDTNTVRVA